MSRSAELRDSAARGRSDAQPKVWILLGNRNGDDNQVRALAEALGWPFEEKVLRYNPLRHVAFLRDERLLHLTGEARSNLVPPWPDLVIGVSYESIPVARFIRRRSGGRAKLIQIGNPRTQIADIDLVLATPQYLLPCAPNVLEIPLPVGNPSRNATATDEEAQWLDAMPTPRRLVAVGGSTRQWRLDVAEIERSIRHLQDQQAKSGGSVIAVTSRRTPPEVMRRLERLLDRNSSALVTSFPRFAVLLAHCDECHVTADSVSMLAEAILAAKPVGMIPVRPSLRGSVGEALRRLGVPLRRKSDLSRFWAYLASHKLVGSVASPVASTVQESTQVAAQAARAVMQRPMRPKIWALLGAHQGDNNQVVALAEAVALPFERKQLTYNRWRHLGPHLLGATFRSLTPASRAILSAEVPDVTISTGHRSVAAVQSLRERSAGKTRSIHVGYPRISPGKFDLVIATPEYPIRDHPNLLRIPFALTRNGPSSECDCGFWDRYPAPRRLLMLGGPTLYWRLAPQTVCVALENLVDLAAREGGCVIAVGSPRTPQRLLHEVERRLRDAKAPAVLARRGGSPPYAELLNHADTIAVTADSVAMISDALVTERPVTLVPVSPTGAGRALMALMDRLRPGERILPRDLRAFWRVLRRNGFVGAGDDRAPVIPDVNSLAAQRCRPIFEETRPAGPNGSGA